MKTFLPKVMLLVDGLLLLQVAAAAAEGVADVQEFQDTIRIAETGIPKVESMVPWLIALLLGTIILGASSSVLQAFSKPWVKPATILLGAVVALIGSLKATFYAIDYATCNQTISDMRGIIRNANKEIENYLKDGISSDDQVKYFKQIEGNVNTLRKLDNLLRASGHAILPPVNFIAVAYAQSKKTNAYDTFSQKGTVIASTKSAGYEFAKYQALETIARERIKPPPQQLNAVIWYLERFSEPAAADCTPTGTLFACTFGVSLTPLYLNPSMLKRFGANKFVSCVADETGDHEEFSLKSPDRAQLMVTAKKQSSFQFHFEANNKEWELTEIDAFRNGPWFFEFRGAHGATADFPLRPYDGRSANETRYQLSPPYALHLPSGPSSLKVTGCKFEM